MSFFARARANLAAADLKVASAMLLNFASSTGIVVSNKLVMDTLGFKYATTLTFMHFIVTFILLWVCALFGVFKIKALPIRNVAKLALGSMGFVVLTNLSLQHNSIGFYQIMKVMTTPTVVIIEALLYKKYLEGPIRLSLIPICLGVILTSANDYKLNLLGTIYAVLGVIVTSFYQIWSGTLQKSLNCDALQLQIYSAPLSALFILPCIPIFDNVKLGDPNSIWNYAYSMTNIPYILSTGVIAFLVNISIFLVIGKSSALTYNILGHAKTCFILTTDFLFFGRPVNLQNTVGIVLAMAGVIWYTHLKLEHQRVEKEASAKQAPLPKAQQEVDISSVSDNSARESATLLDPPPSKGV